MSFLGLRKWPTPARPSPSLSLRQSPNFPCTGRQADVALHHREHADVVPGGQDAGHGCPVCVPSLRRAPASSDTSPAEGFRNDPRNPYREQIAKQSAHH